MGIESPQNSGKPSQSEKTSEEPAQAYREQAFERQMYATGDKMLKKTEHFRDEKTGVEGIRNVDPVTTFLREQGFSGNPELSYSVQIKGSSDAVKFGDFNELKAFIDANRDRIIANPNEVPYRIDYGTGVYEWADHLAPQQKQKLESGWDVFGRSIDFFSDAQDPARENHESSRRDPAMAAEQKRVQELETVKKRLGMDEPKGREANANTPSAVAEFTALLEPSKRVSGYTEDKGAAATKLFFNNLYPDPKVRSIRIEQLAQKYKQILESSRKSHPEKEPKSHENFAANSIMNTLPIEEREALAAFVDNNSHAFFNTSGDLKIRADAPFGAFLRSLAPQD